MMIAIFIAGIAIRFIITLFIFMFIFKVVSSSFKNKFGDGSVRQLFEAAKQARQFEKEEYAREKDVNGLTHLYEPLILKDFPDFNKNLLYSTIERNLVKIFNAIENKDESMIKNDDDIRIVYEQVAEKINDMKQRDIVEKYDGIIFHRHAIKKYERTAKEATIITSSTLEYYYGTNKNETDKNNYSDVKKQTRYTCKFVYIYDESKFKNNESVFTVNCPNCGAPIHGFGNLNCSYCGSYIEPINLKLWRMTSYKEDY